MKRKERDGAAIWQALRRRDRDVRSRQARRELFDQTRLPGARRRGDRHELGPPLAEGALRDEIELREVVLAAEERSACAALADALEEDGAHDGVALSLYLDLL